MAHVNGKENDLAEKQSMTKALEAIVADKDKVNEFYTGLPPPRLNEKDLKKMMADVDAELEEIHNIEDKIRKLKDQFPSADENPEVFYFQSD